MDCKPSKMLSLLQPCPAEQIVRLKMSLRNNYMHFSVVWVLFFRRAAKPESLLHTLFACECGLSRTGNHKVRHRLSVLYGTVLQSVNRTNGYIAKDFWCVFGGARWGVSTSCGDNQIDRPPEQTQAKKLSRTPDSFGSSEATLCRLLNGSENKPKTAAN